MIRSQRLSLNALLCQRRSPVVSFVAVEGQFLRWRSNSCLWSTGYGLRRVVRHLRWKARDQRCSCHAVPCVVLPGFLHDCPARATAAMCTAVSDRLLQQLIPFSQLGSVHAGRAAGDERAAHISQTWPHPPACSIGVISCLGYIGSVEARQAKRCLTADLSVPSASAKKAVSKAYSFPVHTCS